ncbi:disulfide bond formation protein B [Pseudothauera rhizosphaerae]|uniref:Disulfide bond formation protein B n=1 Tax=Pseudothauera rhizosphaerae TaxID=2565932 RepID=A0A4S4AFV4_9RHOO|nr:disulfide bond formation protein B [Pseudothauera rhizosphaerae]THF58076.1 disulfide bond formation protein B [Pseudothauera rhizosphaerae]
MSAATTSSRAWLLLFAAWLVASVSTLGALFFSMVMERPPCVLCWYQRIFMFPLPLVLGVGLLPFDPRAVRYALPLAVAGWLVAAYHCLLYLGFIPAGLQPCTQGVSCADVQIELAGFVTIPLLSLFAFTLIAALLLAARKGTQT